MVKEPTSITGESMQPRAFVVVSGDYAVWALLFALLQAKVVGFNVHEPPEVEVSDCSAGEVGDASNRKIFTSCNGHCHRKLKDHQDDNQPFCSYRLNTK